MAVSLIGAGGNGWDMNTRTGVFSYSQKKQGDWALLRNLISEVDSDILSNKESKKDLIEGYRENMDIHFGYWPNINAGIENISKKITLSPGKEFHIGRETIEYFPYLTVVTQQIAEKLINMGLKTTIKDYSAYSRLFKKNMADQMARQAVTDMIISPITKAVTQKYLMENGIQDPRKLNAEQQQQMQADIDARKRTAIYEETQKILEGSVTPIEKIAHLVYKTTMVRSNLEQKFENGAHYAITCGAQGFLPIFTNNEVFWKNINILNANYRLSQDSPMFEDAIYFNYKEVLTPSELISTYYSILSNKTFKEIDRMFSPIHEQGGFVSSGRVEHQFGDGDYKGAVVGNNLSVPMPVKRGIVDFDKLEYRPAMNTSYAGVEYDPNLVKYLNDAYVNKGFGIEINHRFVRWWAPGYEVTRVENGIEKTYIFGEDYEPSFEDKKVVKKPLPECWRMKEIGSNVLFDIGPVPYQYPFPDNLMQSELGVYGGEMGNVFNNEIPNSTIVGPAKRYELQFSLLNNTLMDVVNNPLMDVIKVPQSLLNGEYGADGFFNMLYKLQVLVYPDQGDIGSGGQGMDPAKAIGVLQVNKTAQINNLMSLINYYKGMMVEVSRYNSGQLADLKDYANTAVVQNSGRSVDRGLNHYYSMMARIRNSVVAAATRFNMHEYIKNDAVIDNYFDDYSANYFKNNHLEVIGSAIHFDTPNNVEAKKTFEMFKDLLLRYLSTGGEIDEAGESMLADDLKGAIEIAKKAREKRDRQMAESRDHELKMVQAGDQNKYNMLMAEWQQRLQLGREANQTKEKTSYLNSIQLQNAGDIDMSGQADFIENQDKERQLKLLMHQDKMRLEEQKLLKTSK